jgi:hypothetical protein
MLGDSIFNRIAMGAPGDGKAGDCGKIAIWGALPRQKIDLPKSAQRP